MSVTLERQAAGHSNDYSDLEARYRAAAGAQLVLDPHGSALQPLPEVTLSASVVIPAWNAADTLAQCLIAIEQSSFNRRYGERLEVVVVDDGSTDGTWELLERLDVRLQLVAVQQQHHSRAQTQNTGIAIARGDVVISCDADMILAPFAIEELVKRHQLLPDVMLIGFRGDVSREDPRIRPAALRDHVPAFLPPFAHDVRLRLGAWGWPDNMCRDSGHMKRLRQDRPILMADGSRWNLPGMVYGALFSLRRSDFATMDGYDERFYGWGCEDTLVGVRALALGRSIVPVYSAAGLHIAHGDRSPRKWQEFAANRRVFQAILQAPFATHDGQWLSCAPQRILRRFERGSPAGLSANGHLAQAEDALRADLVDPDRRGKHWHALGRYDDAAAAFAEVRGSPVDEAWALFDRGKALRAGGRFDEAAGLFEEAAGRPELAANPWPPVELALAWAALGRFKPARQQLDRAHALDPRNPALEFLLRRPIARHLERASQYVRLGEDALAAATYEAALIQDPDHARARQERELCLQRLGRAAPSGGSAGSRTAGARTNARAAQSQNGRRREEEAAAHLAAASAHLAAGRLEQAHAALEGARRARPQERELGRYADALAAAARRRRPLPHPAWLAAEVKEIPGWLGADEAELLGALALRSLAACGPEPLVLVEIGRYCGRATTLLALAARALGREDAAIVAVDEPSLARAPDGRPAVDALRATLENHRVAGLVRLAPEEEAAAWELRSLLVLVDGRHDAEGVGADVARYAPGLAPDGLLVFHDYAPYFPDVQQCVDDLLASGQWEFVAHASSLIALGRSSGGQP
jgi:glycosyltransferase involved in cell wall biosynthesis/tetratricopeptide (TPR) repeat protein